MEELTDNAEEPDEAESKQSEVKLGKLQYKVKFFFQFQSQHQSLTISSIVLIKFQINYHLTSQEINCSNS